MNKGCEVNMDQGFNQDVGLELTYWRDDEFNYFRSSDGRVYYMPRDFEYEAWEVEHGRMLRKIALIKWAAKCLIVAFVTADLIVLAMLLVLNHLMIGGT